jgi:FkbH-like protein
VGFTILVRSAGGTPSVEASNLLKRALLLRAQGRGREALTALQDGLRTGILGAENGHQVGLFICKELQAGLVDLPAVHVCLLGQCTTSWLATTLTAVAWSQGSLLMVTQGGLDTVLQDLTRLPSAPERPDVIVLLPWHERLLGAGSLNPEQRLEAELAYWRQAWDCWAAASRSRLLQVGYDWATLSAQGLFLSGQPDGHIWLLRQLNARLRSELPPGSYFLDLELVSGWFGRESFYDPRQYLWTKQPFSERGLWRLAEHVWAGIRALIHGPRKVLVVDLDDTIWGGVVGEIGPLGIVLGDGPDGEAYRTFQLHIKELARRGIVLTVASKNNPEDAREPFLTNPNMVLTLDDFAAIEASWEPKSVMLQNLARKLNLGLDSFVFFDDNRVEREQVRQAVPEVVVVDVPVEPADYVRALQAGLWFEASALTQEDQVRAEHYQLERARRDHQQTYQSLDQYLASLEMEAEVLDCHEADLPRVLQLLGKTSQFNLTTRRHTRDDLLQLLSVPRMLALTLRVRDRFGDHGLVSILLGVPLAGEPDAVRIDTWLMSCRVIGRTVEYFFFAAFLARSRELGYRKALGEYLPTKKNDLVRGLYKELGFRPLPDSDGIFRFELDLNQAVEPATQVRAKG